MADSAVGIAASERVSTKTLEGKTVVIFGGTSGIGLSAAIQAKALGAKIFAIGSQPQVAVQTAERYGFAGGRGADVTQPATITKALEGITQVDHLVLLAGTFVVGKVLEAEVSHLRK